MPAISLAQSYLPDALLVVNNVSTDGATEILSQEFSSIQRLDMKEDLGGAGGFFLG
jgi:GT2 family glycosyltransferase